jgi:hypothetical protein
MNHCASSSLLFLPKHSQMYTPSSTSIDRLIRCEASHLLPRTSSISDKTERGSALHPFLDVLVYNPTPEKRLEALQAVPAEWRHTAMGVDISVAMEGILEPETEVAFAVETETGSARVIGHHIDRMYAPLIKPGEVPGTADVIGRRVGDGIPVCLDWKTGKHVGDIEDFWQTRFFALALASLASASSVEVRIAYVRDNGQVDVEIYEFNNFELDSFADTLKAAHRRLLVASDIYDKTGETRPVTGSQCDWCPSIPYCPAHTKLAKAMLPELDGIASAIQSLSDEDAGRAWKKYRTIAKVADRIGKSLRLRGKCAPIPLGDGLALGPVNCKRKSFDEASAKQLLMKVGVSVDEINKRCYKTTYYTKVDEIKIKE